MSCPYANYIGKFGKPRVKIQGLDGSAELTISEGTAYASGDAIHSNYITFAGASRSELTTGSIVGSFYQEISGGTAANIPYILYIFDTAPSNQTANSAVNISDADFAQCIGKVTQAAGTTMETKYGFGQTDSKEIPYKTTSTDTALYGIMVATGAGTYTATTTLKVFLNVAHD